MDFIKGILQNAPAIGGLFKGKDGGAATSEFTALAGLYAVVVTIECAGWIKVVTLGAATLGYAWLRTNAKKAEVA